MDILHKPTPGLDEVDKEFCRQFLAFLRTAEDMRYKEGGHVISENSQHGYQKALIGHRNSEQITRTQGYGTLMVPVT